MIHGTTHIHTVSIVHGVSDTVLDMAAGTILGFTAAGTHHGDIADGIHHSITPVGIARGVTVDMVTTAADTDMDTVQVSEMVITPVSHTTVPEEAQVLTELPPAVGQVFQVQVAQAHHVVHQSAVQEQAEDHLPHIAEQQAAHAVQQ